MVALKVEMMVDYLAGKTADPWGHQSVAWKAVKRVALTVERKVALRAAKMVATKVVKKVALKVDKRVATRVASMADKMVDLKAA